MEFLDPQKRKEHLIRLMIGYVLVAIALALTTIVLLYQAYGFGLRNGEVIQNGLVFISSNPKNADIYVNGVKKDKKTNTRLLMEAGQYTFRLQRDGYRTWKRAVNIEGGSVARFDYPFLFPTKLETESIKHYKSKPAIVSQSPDRRWLLVQDAQAPYNTFEVVDLSDKNNATTDITIPIEALAAPGAGGTHSWEEVSWADDNRHVLLNHIVSGTGATSEYILVDTQKANESVNATKLLSARTSKIDLLDRKYDKFAIHDQAGQILSTATLNSSEPTVVAKGVLAYKSYSDDTFLYATALDNSPDEVQIKLRQGDKTYDIRHVSVSDKYMLDLAKYDGDWYVVAGSPADNKTYIYRNPVSVLGDDADSPLVPVQILKTASAEYVSFSDNTRFIMAQGGQNFAVYDAENEKGYSYTVKSPIDAGQPHANWMDGHRMMFISSGKVYVFDFDNANRESLAAADVSYQPMFDKNYENLITIAPKTASDGTVEYHINRTALLTAADK